MLTTLAMLVLAGGEVSLDVAPGVVCVERARVVERLGREGVKVVEVTKGLAVDVRLSGATIDVRGRLRNEVLERQLPANARDCPGVERVLAALIVSWARRLPQPTAQPPSPLAGERGDAPSDSMRVDGGVRLSLSEWNDAGSRGLSPSARGEAGSTDSSIAARSDGGRTGSSLAARGDADSTDSSLIVRSDGGRTGSSLAARGDAGSTDSSLIARSGGGSTNSSLSVRRDAGGTDSSLAARSDAGSTDSSLPVRGDARNNDSSLAARSDAGTDSSLIARSDTRSTDSSLPVRGDARNNDSSLAATSDAGTSNSSLSVQSDDRNNDPSLAARSDAGSTNSSLSVRSDARNNDSSLAAPSDAGGTDSSLSVRSDARNNDLTARSDPGINGSRFSARGGPGNTAALSRSESDDRDGGTVSLVTAEGGVSPLSPTLSPAGGEGDGGVSSAAVAAVPGDAGSSSVTLDLGAMGGGSIGPTAAVTGAGQAHVALGFGRFGLAVDLGLESSRSRAVEPATVTSTAQWLSVQARVAFQPFTRLRLEVLLGLRGWRLTAASTGIDEPAQTELFSFGGVGTAAASFQLWGPISLQLRAFASARWRTERFSVTNLGPVLELLPWAGGVLGGVEIRFGT